MLTLRARGRHLGDPEEDIERLAVRRKMVGDGARRRQFIGVRHVEGLAIGHDAGAFGEAEQAVAKGVGIDVERGDTPVGKLGRRKPELEGVLKKLVLRLELLGGEKHPLGPDDTVAVSHV